MATNHPNIENKDNKVEVDSDFLYSIIAVLEKHDYPSKEAVIGTKRMEYIKEKDFFEYVDKYQDEVFKLCENVSNYVIQKNSDLGKSLIDIFKTERLIFEAKPSVHDRKLKYPKRLFPLDGSIKADSDEDVGDIKNTTTKKFYIIAKKRTEKKYSIWLWVLILGVLAFCLFPVWPLEVKLGIWWVSWILLILMVSYSNLINNRLA